MEKHSYEVHHGDQHGSSKQYCVWDSVLKKVPFASDSKSEVIAEAQRLNGFSTVDGDEQTYGKQIIDGERQRIELLDNADYDDMKPNWWPTIPDEDKATYERLLTVVKNARWISRRERAEWHRYLVYAFSLAERPNQ